MPTIVKDLKTSKKIVTQKSVRVFIKRATYERLNHRRYELVAKKNREGLNMGWFNKNSIPKPDPIGDICKSLVEKWFEWEPTESARPRGGGNPGYRHPSGIHVFYSSGGSAIWLGDTAGTIQLIHDTSITKRLWGAILGHMSAKINGKDTFDSTSKSLAQAVMKGDKTAARALYDRLTELISEGKF